MSSSFDLISDLHIDFWPSEDNLRWEGLGTSLVAVVLGDISYDIEKAYKTIVDISKHYRYVVFVDGNHEHGNQCGFQEHNAILKNRLSKYQNISFLNRSAVVIDGVAFVGANGWWTFDFCEPKISIDEAYLYYMANGIYTEPFMQEVYATAKEDAAIMAEMVAKLTIDPAVHEIVMLSHTSPSNIFIEKGTFQDTIEYTRCGNSRLLGAINYDIEEKISTWCFGHVHKEYDQIFDGIRFVSHPRGRQDDCPHNKIYYPKLIDLTIGFQPNG